MPEISNERVVAILVEKSAKVELGEALKTYEIDVQNKMDAQVVEIEIPADISPFEVYEGLSHLYFSGLGGASSSQLIGTILVGDVPLPIVEKGGNLWPSVFPYVDLENPDYEWNFSKERFVYVGGDQQPEIWHGVIRGDDLVDFFANNHVFHVGDLNFSKKAFYANFEDQKTLHDRKSYFSYTQWIKYLEEIFYLRYSKHFAKQVVLDEVSREISLIKNQDGVFDGEIDLTAFEAMKYSPDVFLDALLANYLQRYTKISKSWLSAIHDRVSGGARWDNLSIETTPSLVSRKDELSVLTLMEFNKQVEANFLVELEKTKMATKRPVQVDKWLVSNNFSAGIDSLVAPALWNSDDQREVSLGGGVGPLYQSGVDLSVMRNASEGVLVRGHKNDVNKAPFAQMVEANSVMSLVTQDKCPVAGVNPVSGGGGALEYCCYDNSNQDFDLNSITYHPACVSTSRYKESTHVGPVTPLFDILGTKEVLGDLGGKWAADMFNDSLSISLADTGDSFGGMNDSSLVCEDSGHSDFVEKLAAQVRGKNWVETLTVHNEPSAETWRLQKQENLAESDPKGMAYYLPIDDPRGVSFYDGQEDFLEYPFVNVFDYRQKYADKESFVAAIKEDFGNQIAAINEKIKLNNKNIQSRFSAEKQTMWKLEKPKLPLVFPGDIEVEKTCEKTESGESCVYNGDSLAVTEVFSSQNNTSCPVGGCCYVNDSRYEIEGKIKGKAFNVSRKCAYQPLTHALSEQDMFAADLNLPEDKPGYNQWVEFCNYKVLGNGGVKYFKTTNILTKYYQVAKPVFDKFYYKKAIENIGWGFLWDSLRWVDVPVELKNKEVLAKAFSEDVESQDFFKDKTRQGYEFAALVGRGDNNRIYDDKSISFVTNNKIELLNFSEEKLDISAGALADSASVVVKNYLDDNDSGLSVGFTPEVGEGDNVFKSYVAIDNAFEFEAGSIADLEIFGGVTEKKGSEVEEPENVSLDLRTGKIIEDKPVGQLSVFPRKILTSLNPEELVKVEVKLLDADRRFLKKNGVRVFLESSSSDFDEFFEVLPGKELVTSGGRVTYFLKAKDVARGGKFSFKLRAGDHFSAEIPVVVMRSNISVTADKDEIVVKDIFGTMVKAFVLDEYGKPANKYDGKSLLFRVKYDGVFQGGKNAVIKNGVAESLFFPGKKSGLERIVVSDPAGDLPNGALNLTLIPDVPAVIRLDSEHDFLVPGADYSKVVVNIYDKYFNKIDYLRHYFNWEVRNLLVQNSAELDGDVLKPGIQERVIHGDSELFIKPNVNKKGVQVATVKVTSDLLPENISVEKKFEILSDPQLRLTSSKLPLIAGTKSLMQVDMRLEDGEANLIKGDFEFDLKLNVDGVGNVPKVVKVRDGKGLFYISAGFLAGNNEVLVSGNNFDATRLRFEVLPFLPAKIELNTEYDALYKSMGDSVKVKAVVYDIYENIIKTGVDKINIFATPLTADLVEFLPNSITGKPAGKSGEMFIMDGKGEVLAKKLEGQGFVHLVAEGDTNLSLLNTKILFFRGNSSSELSIDTVEKSLSVDYVQGLSDKLTLGTLNFELTNNHLVSELERDFTPRALFSLALGFDGLNLFNLNKSWANTFLMKGDGQAMGTLLVDPEQKRNFGTISPDGKSWGENLSLQLISAENFKIKLSVDDKDLGFLNLFFKEAPVFSMGTVKEISAENFVPNSFVFELKDDFKNKFRIENNTLFNEGVGVFGVNDFGGVNFMNADFELSQRKLVDKDASIFEWSIVWKGGVIGVLQISPSEAVLKPLATKIPRKNSRLLDLAINDKFAYLFVEFDETLVEVKEAFTGNSSNGLIGIKLLSKYEKELDRKKLGSDLDSAEDAVDNPMVIWDREWNPAALFSAGNTAGESSAPNSSDAFILLGDPTISLSDNARGSHNFTPDLGQLIWKNKDGKKIDKILSGDVNNDGKVDLLFLVNKKLRILYSAEKDKINFYDAGYLLSFADGVQEIDVLDIDNDGFTDILQLNRQGKLVLHKNTKGTFRRILIDTKDKRISNFRLGNLDLDKQKDLVFTDEENNFWKAGFENSAGKLSSPQFIESYSTHPEKIDSAVYMDSLLVNTNELNSLGKVDLANNKTNDLTLMNERYFKSLTNRSGVKADLSVKKLTPLAGRLKPLELLNFELLLENNVGETLEDVVLYFPGNSVVSPLLGSYQCLGCEFTHDLVIERDSDSKGFFVSLKDLKAKGVLKLRWKGEVAQLPVMQFFLSDLENSLDEIDDLLINTTNLETGEPVIDLFKSTLDNSLFSKGDSSIFNLVYASTTSSNKTSHDCGALSMQTNDEVLEAQKSNPTAADKGNFDYLEGVEEIEVTRSSYECGGGTCSGQVAAKAPTAPGLSVNYSPKAGGEIGQNDPRVSMGGNGSGMGSLTSMYPTPLSKSVIRNYAVPVSGGGGIGMASVICFGKRNPHWSQTSAWAPNCIVSAGKPAEIGGTCGKTYSRLDLFKTAIDVSQSVGDGAVMSSGKSGESKPPLAKPPMEAFDKTIKEVENIQIPGADVATTWLQFQVREINRQAQRSTLTLVLPNNAMNVNTDNKGKSDIVGDGVVEKLYRELNQSPSIEMELEDVMIPYLDIPELEYQKMHEDFADYQANFVPAFKKRLSDCIANTDRNTDGDRANCKANQQLLEKYINQYALNLKRLKKYQSASEDLLHWRKYMLEDVSNVLKSLEQIETFNKNYFTAIATTVAEWDKQQEKLFGVLAEWQGVISQFFLKFTKSTYCKVDRGTSTEWLFRDFNKAGNTYAPGGSSYYDSIRSQVVRINRSMDITLDVSNAQPHLSVKIANPVLTPVGQTLELPNRFVDAKTLIVLPKVYPPLALPSRERSIQNLDLPSLSLVGLDSIKKEMDKDFEEFKAITAKLKSLMQTAQGLGGLFLPIIVNATVVPEWYVRPHIENLGNRTVLSDFLDFSGGGLVDRIGKPANKEDRRSVFSSTQKHLEGTLEWANQLSIEHNSTSNSIAIQNNYEKDVAAPEMQALIKKGDANNNAKKTAKVEDGEVVATEVVDGNEIHSKAQIGNLTGNLNDAALGDLLNSGVSGLSNITNFGGDLFPNLPGFGGGLDGLDSGFDALDGMKDAIDKAGEVLDKIPDFSFASPQELYLGELQESVQKFPAVSELESEIQRNLLSLNLTPNHELIADFSNDLSRNMAEDKALYQDLYDELSRENDILAKYQKLPISDFLAQVEVQNVLNEKDSRYLVSKTFRPQLSDLSSGDMAVEMSDKIIVENNNVSSNDNGPQDEKANAGIYFMAPKDVNIGTVIKGEDGRSLSAELVVDYLDANKKVLGENLEITNKYHRSKRVTRDELFFSVDHTVSSLDAELGGVFKYLVIVADAEMVARLQALFPINLEDSSQLNYQDFFETGNVLNVNDLKQVIVDDSLEEGHRKLVEKSAEKHSYIFVQASTDEFDFEKNRESVIKKHALNEARLKFLNDYDKDHVFKVIGFFEKSLSISPDELGTHLASDQKAEKIIEARVYGKSRQTFVDLDNDSLSELIYSSGDLVFVKSRIPRENADKHRDIIYWNEAIFTSKFISAGSVKLHSTVSGVGVTFENKGENVNYLEWIRTDRPDYLWELAKDPKDKLSKVWDRKGFLVRAATNLFEIRKFPGRVLEVQGEPVYHGPMTKILPTFEKNLCKLDKNKHVISRDSLLIGKAEKNALLINVPEIDNTKASKGRVLYLSKGEETRVKFAQICVFDGQVEIYDPLNKFISTPVQEGFYLGEEGKILTKKGSDDFVKLKLFDGNKLTIKAGENYSFKYVEDGNRELEEFSFLNYGNFYGFLVGVRDFSESFIIPHLLHDPQRAQDTLPVDIIIKGGDEQLVYLGDNIVIDASNSIEYQGIKNVWWDLNTKIDTDKDGDPANDKDFPRDSVSFKDKESLLKVELNPHYSKETKTVKIMIEDLSDNYSEKEISIISIPPQLTVNEARVDENHVKGSVSAEKLEVQLYRLRDNNLVKIRDGVESVDESFELKKLKSEGGILFHNKKNDEKIAEITESGRVVIYDDSVRLHFDTAGLAHPFRMRLEGKRGESLAYLNYNRPRVRFVEIETNENYVDLNSKNIRFMKNVHLLDRNKADKYILKSLPLGVINFSGGVSIIDTEKNESIGLVDVTGDLYSDILKVSMKPAQDKNDPVIFELYDGETLIADFYINKEGTPVLEGS